MEHRATREDEFLAEVIPLDTETLVLYPAEQSAPQSQRFESWLEDITKTRAGRLDQIPLRSVRVN